jgi:hypothetical protein
LSQPRGWFGGTALRICRPFPRSEPRAAATQINSTRFTRFRSSRHRLDTLHGWLFAVFAWQVPALVTPRPFSPRPLEP